MVVLLEFGAIPESHNATGHLEEDDVVVLVVYSTVDAPTERFVERLGARHVINSEGDQAYSLLQLLYSFVRVTD